MSHPYALKAAWRTVLLAAVFSSASCSAAVIHVRPAGNDIDDGSTWQLAKRTVQSAISAATAGDQIWVAEGTYTGPFTLTAGVSLYGGFAGTEEALEQRDPDGNPTILDGARLQVIVTVASGAGPDTRIDGFTIQNGKAPATGTGPGEFGAIICKYASPTISNNTFTANGITPIHCDHSFSVISGNVITGNAPTRPESAGGIYCKSSSPEIVGNTIRANTATEAGSGGAIYCTFASPEIMGNTIEGNSDSGIVCDFSTAFIRHNIISGNSATASSAGGGGIRCSFSSGVIANNVIAGNIAFDAGGGVLLTSASPAITNNTVVENTANNGGGLSFYASSPAVSNNIVAFNTTGIHQSPTPSAAMRNNCVYGNIDYDYMPDVRGEGDINENPLLFDIAGENYHLTVLSPCINAGWNGAPALPSVDLDGEPRINEEIVDIGADEFVPTTATTIQDAKLSADGNSVDIGGVTVSASFTGYFYVESDSRNAGIRVEFAGHDVQRGDRLDVEGTVRTSEDGERYIQAISADKTGIGTVVPLNVPSRWLGGADWYHQGVSGAGQRGIAGAEGLNNIGLLVRTWGTVTVSPRRDWFYIDDGSGIKDGTGMVGIYVDAEALQVPPVGAYVRVTGISRCELYKGRCVNVLLARDQADIEVVADPAAGLEAHLPLENPRGK